MPRWLVLGLFLVSLVFTVVSGGPRRAHAEDKAKAKALLVKGDKALQRGDRYLEQNHPDKANDAWAEALKFYLQAHDEYASPQIYFPIALAEQRLGNFLDAMHHYEAVLKETENPKPALVAEVDKQILRVRTNLTALELIVDQPGAVVRVDGKDVGLTPLEGPYYLLPGIHKVTVSKDGYSPQEETLNTERGQVVSREGSPRPLRRCLASGRGAPQGPRPRQDLSLGHGRLAGRGPAGGGVRHLLLLHHLQVGARNRCHGFQREYCSLRNRRRSRRGTRRQLLIPWWDACLLPGA